MALDGRAVANFILDFCESKNREVSNLALQKIIYFCHVWSLIKLEQPLIKHQFEAWQYGPVLQYLYSEFKAFDDKPIRSRATAIDTATGERRIAQYEFDSDMEELLSQTIDFYSRLSAIDLMKLSHAKGSPWDKVWNHQGPVNPGMKIGNELIVSYYSKVPAPYLIQ